MLAMHAAALLVFGAANAAAKAPERIVQGSTVTSARDPAVSISVPTAAVYVGGDRWDLYDVADCEIHVFVEADAEKRVQRLYWIQFEGFLPTNARSYKYPFTEKLTHAGLEFDVRAQVGDTPVKPKTGSDFQRVKMLVEKAGYQLPGAQMNVRLVHLLDDTKRKELMIIYAEDLATTGHTSAELKAASGEVRWEEIKADLIKRALENIRIK